ncbi:MAG TPA: D-alanyl-D-alanine carboxypeptidase [Acidimicrobiales bacterium]|nr:D-alanyl-D-alanine carboxypeptidase [Acidimicrobiales bacterium]
MKRGRGVASVLLAISAASAGAAAHSAGAFGGSDLPAVAVEARTAVLSPRRAPDAFVTFVADTRLAARLRAFAESVPGEECLSVEAEGRPVLRHNDAEPLIPASTMKLLTARAAVIELGSPSKTNALNVYSAPFSTDVFGAKPDGDGVVQGDLVIEGGGDPLLMTPDYAASLKRPIKKFTDPNDLVTRLRNEGVRRVTGRVVGSDDRFDEERYVPTWKSSYASNGDVGPVGALAVNDGYVSFGDPPVAARDPALAAAELFRSLLVAAGVAVDGPAVSDDPPASGVLLATKASLPLDDILRELLVESDNNTAELLLRSLGKPNAGSKVTRAEGVALLRQTLTRARLPVGDLTAVDGSGLDRGNRASCRLLLGALGPRGDFIGRMARAGHSGTLFDRFRDHPLRNKLEAKTGALAGVVGLVGHTDTRTKIPQVRFAFLANGSFSEPAGRALQERLGEVLATYPQSPPASAIAP